MNMMAQEEKHRYIASGNPRSLRRIFAANRSTKAPCAVSVLARAGGRAVGAGGWAYCAPASSQTNRRLFCVSFIKFPTTPFRIRETFTLANESTYGVVPSECWRQLLMHT